VSPVLQRYFSGHSVRRFIIHNSRSYFALAVLFRCASSFGQTQEAREWLDQGLSASSPAEKIAAYQRAIELDPAFTEAYYNLGLTYKAQRNFVEAEQAFYKASTVNPGNTKTETRLRILFELGATSRRLGKFAGAQDPFLEYYYTTGRTDQRSGNWTQAITAFEAAAQIDPDYRDLRLRVSQTQRQLNKLDREELLGRYYTDGLVAMQRKDFTLAINAFQRVQQISSGYRDAANRLAQARIALERAASQENAEKISPDVEQFYQHGLAALQGGDYVNAFVNFKSLELISPHYKDTDKRLEEAKRKLSESVPRAPGRTLAGDMALAGAVALTIILPVVGVYLFSPAAKARLLLLQGDYEKAAHIYERLLAKRPTRLKLYPVLANIYLLVGRTDETAIKVFKMILQLNLLAHRRDDINAIVAQRFLSEGRKDHDAINVMENALLVEMRKLGQSAKPF